MNNNKNIYNEEELQESATSEDFSVVQKEGSRFVKRKVVCYNLDAREMIKKLNQ